MIIGLNRLIITLYLIEYWGEGNKQTFNSACPWRRDDRLNVCHKIIFYYN